MADMLNLGKARVKVELLDSLPNVTKKSQAYDVDQSALAWTYFMASPFAPPALLEYVSDTTGQFGAIFPSRRKFFIDNHIASKDGSPITKNLGEEKIYMLWSPTQEKEGMIKALIDNGKFDTYNLSFPPEYTQDYTGPRWEDKPLPKESQPFTLDSEVAKKWADVIGMTFDPSTYAEDNSDDAIPTVYSVNQTNVRDGLWWGLESVDSWISNTPFWVTINRTQSPTSNAQHETFIAISLGIGDDEQSYDLVITNNKRPLLFDYFNGRQSTDAKSTGGSGLPSFKVEEFPTDLSKITEKDTTIEVGFMTTAGRLVVFVNKTVLVYRRVESGSEAKERQGTWKEAKISDGKIRIYGSNCQCTVNFCPMTFSPFGALVLPFGDVPNEEDTSGGGNKRWFNMDSKGNVGSGSVIELPNPEGKHDPPFGVDCESFTSTTCGSSNPSQSAGLHLEGKVTMKSSSELGVDQTVSGFHVMIFNPTDFDYTLNGVTSFVPYSGCPYFFRIKGGYRYIQGGSGGSGRDISEDVISATETFSIDDYFAINGTAQVTLYNKGGKYDELKTQQKGIRLYWGWNGDYHKTFTGLVVSASSSEVPGKEELTLECSDYMFLLKNTQMINSPYYDGMVLFYACRDVIKRAGIQEIINDWDDTDEYFLPTGYSFTNPAVKFDDQQMLYDCVKSMVERGEATFYFDSEGRCHIMKLPGGLFSVSSGAGSQNIKFVRDPELQSSSGSIFTILDTKGVEYDYSETVNKLFLYSLERDTRNPIIVVVSAKGGEDKLLYMRLFYVQQPAFGSLRIAQHYADMLGKRAFYPVRKTSFKTVGTGNIVYPLSFVQVDSDEYRLTGVSRKYSADSNEFVMDFNAEWLGGK